tara:strand:+ start:188 stop:733 length:546 start_codon:yes stop_codon:yes gene_type:complete
MDELSGVLTTFSQQDFTSISSALDIIKQGLIGLIFLLSLMAFRLLNSEQKKEQSDVNIVSSINKYMYLNTFLAILVFISSVNNGDDSEPQKLTAKISTDITSVAVCSESKLVHRFVLLTHQDQQKMVQYKASAFPCTEESSQIWLSKDVAMQLGITSNGIEITAIAALKGQKFADEFMRGI